MRHPANTQKKKQNKTDNNTFKFWKELQANPEYYEPCISYGN